MCVITAQEAASPKRLHSLTLKLETASLKISDIGVIPACTAGTAKPAPTAEALSLKGLQSTLGKSEHQMNVYYRKQGNVSTFRLLSSFKSMCV